MKNKQSLRSSELEKLQLKIKNLLVRFWSVLFIVGVWFIFAHPYLVLGRVPYASTYQVNFFPPWSHYEKFWGPVKNNAMPDVHTQIYPWKKFTIDTYKDGQLPLWNPYSFAGNPHLANFQSAVLSPFNLLFFLPAGRQGILPFIDAWSIIVLLQPLMAGLFMYLFVREVGVSRAGSIVSSIAFMFSGFMVAWMAYGTLVFAILYLPLTLYAVERYVKTRRLRFLLLMVSVIPLSFFSGHFQISLYFLGTLITYAIFRTITIKPLITISERGLYQLIISILVGLSVSSLQLIPSIQLYLNSVRSEIFVEGGGIPIYYLINVFAPDFFGNPVTRNDWFGFYAEWASFVGIIPFILALYAIFKIKSKICLFFTGVAMVALFLAVSSPIQTFLGSLKIPVLSTSNPSRIIILFSFSLAVLSGFGLDKLLKKIKERKKLKVTILPFLVMMIFITLVWFVTLFTKIYPDEWLIVAKRNFVLPTALFVIAVITIFLSIKAKKFLLITTCFLLLATSFDSLRFAQKWMSFDPKEFVYPELPIITKMREETRGVERVFGNLGAEVTTYYRIPSIEGYDPLYIGRFGEFIRAASTGELLKGERSVVRLDRRGLYTDRVLDILGVSLIFHPIPDTNQGWAYPVWEDNKRHALIYRDDKLELYKNNNVMPRVSLFYDYEVIREDKEIIKRFYSKDFDFQKKLILEEEPLLDSNSLNKSEDASGSAEIISYTPNKIRISVKTVSPGLLFLSDNFYPGWKARLYFFEVPAKEIKMYRADYAFRAIVVPAGSWIAEFSYENII